MNHSQNIERLLVNTSRIILACIFLMLFVLPGVFTKSIPNEYNTGAVIAISLAIIIRILIYARYVSMIKRIRSSGKVKKSTLKILAVLLIIFGLIYSDGAMAYSNNENVLYLSYMMFGSVICDLTAAVFTFRANYLAKQ